LSTSTPIDAVAPAERTPVLPLFSPSAPAPRTAETDAARVALVAIGLILASTVSFAVCDVAAKMLQTEASADRITWWRYVTYFAISVPLALRRDGLGALRPSAPGLQVLRGALSILCTFLFLYGLRFLDIPETTAIAFAAPIFVLGLSIVFLGEKVGPARWIGAVISFAGVLIIVRPGAAGFSMAAMFPVLSALAGAGATVITRRLRTDSAETTMLWTSTIGFAVSTALVLPAWSAPSLFEIACGLGTGIGFGIAQVMVVTAYRMAPVSMLAPFSYAQMPTAGLFSVVFFGVMPNVWTLMGSALIAGSGIYAAHHERSRAAEDAD
jgi:drug/metabolite transporter (DMT)-like permease